MFISLAAVEAAEHLLTVQEAVVGEPELWYCWSLPWEVVEVLVEQQLFLYFYFYSDKFSENLYMVPEKVDLY